VITESERETAWVTPYRSLPPRFTPSRRSDKRGWWIVSETMVWGPYATEVDARTGRQALAERGLLRPPYVVGGGMVGLACPCCGVVFQAGDELRGVPSYHVTCYGPRGRVLSGDHEGDDTRKRYPTRDGFGARKV
jgi:hypothetical protein